MKTTTKTVQLATVCNLIDRAVEMSGAKAVTTLAKARNLAARLPANDMAQIADDLNRAIAIVR